MTTIILSEQLKALRKKHSMTQEQLAEKLGVSRQAITKWETNLGVPDVENIVALSQLFGVSMEELLFARGAAEQKGEFLYESVTEYDIDEVKHFDMDLSSMREVSLMGYEGEKIRVVLSSNEIKDIERYFKVKIDDIRKRIDLSIHHKHPITEMESKDKLHVFVQLPASYIKDIECAARASCMHLISIECQNIELDIRTSRLILDTICSPVEINCNQDMDIQCMTLEKDISINQISSTSTIHIPDGTKFTAVQKGMRTKILFKKGEQTTESFSVPNAESIIEINGFKSELTIQMEDVV